MPYLVSVRKEGTLGPPLDCFCLRLMAVKILLFFLCLYSVHLLPLQHGWWVGFALLENGGYWLCHAWYMWAGGRLSGRGGPDSAWYARLLTELLLMMNARE